MNSVKCLLMGSAAGLMAVSAAQAADLPVKAAPVEYVKVCNIYGAGFWYVPGTDTCMKIGTWVRYEIMMNEGDGGVQFGFGASSTAAGRLTRIDTSTISNQYRALVTIDARTQTDFGTLRSYMDVGTKFQSYATWPSSASAGPHRGGRQFNSQWNNNNVDATRAFIQFAGLHRGPHPVALRHRRAGRLHAVEQPHPLGYRRRRHVRHRLHGAVQRRHLAQPVARRPGPRQPGACALDGRPVATSTGAVPLAPSWSRAAASVAAPRRSAAVRPSTTPALNFWDAVVNLRIDQSWGYAAVSGAIHQNGGGYYNNAINSTNATMANTVVQGHPGDSYGWAGSAGFLLTDFLGLKGDTLAFGTQYGHGAVGYVFKSPGTYFLAGNGNHIAFGNTLDGVFANGTGVDMSDAWSAWMGLRALLDSEAAHGLPGRCCGDQLQRRRQVADVRWCPRLRGEPEQRLGLRLCELHGLAGGLRQRLVSGLAVQPELRLVAGRYADHLEPAPRPRYRRRSDVQAIKTANRGATVWQNGASGGMAPGLYSFANEGIWSAAFRIQRNFLP